MKQTYILTHDAEGRELYEPHVLNITPEHAASLRERGMMLKEAQHGPTNT